ncbi:MAG: DUF3786 domain-containing protein [Desulfomonilaceae bacterium]|nr:DUF3786 domain-containing protein [Desulfomonilaceae bacterium]
MQRVTAMDILKRLPKTNCRECGLPTCLAFAAMVLQGQARLLQCPCIDREAASLLRTIDAREMPSPEARRDELMAVLKKKIKSVNFSDVAPRLDAEVSGERLRVRCLGRNFDLDKNGNLHSECHINSWVHLPIINYTIHGQGRDVTGEWVRFSELRNAADWTRFFSHRCEKGMQHIADGDPDLFFDAIDLFAARRAEANAGEAFATADYAKVVFPLPKVPMLIAYWKAEDEFDAGLSLLFDRSAEVNLGAESIYLLIMGLLEMLKRIMARHGFRQ